VFGGRETARTCLKWHPLFARNLQVFPCLQTAGCLCLHDVF
jgi:hypothetical protein